MTLRLARPTLLIAAVERGDSVGQLEAGRASEVLNAVHHLPRCALVLSTQSVRVVSMATIHAWSKATE